MNFGQTITSLECVQHMSREVSLTMFRRRQHCWALHQRNTLFGFTIFR